MRSITPKLTSEIEAHCGKQAVWRAVAFPVSNYRQLVEHVARLAFANADELLFYRGQDKDYQSKAGGTTLYPAIYRSDNLPHRELRHRFDVLDQAARVLIQLFAARKIEGHKDVSRKRYIQWSILQHYQVVPTPLLDLTQSLRVACSFAQIASTDSECYVYALGLPYLMGRIAINSEHDIANVRLLSICPPNALRPYFQEGFLAGTADLTTDFDAKTELDFRNRLVAKFAIPRTKRFWGSGFDVVPESALYPDGDAIKELCDEIREQLRSETLPGDLGTFIQHWAELENRLLEEGRRLSERNVSVREAINILARQGRLPKESATHLDFLRRVRNAAVHSPTKVPPTDLASATERVREFLRDWPAQAR
jgi:hypothetical protein